MLMASYDDGTNIGFWDGLRPRRHQTPMGAPHPGAGSAWSDYPATPSMVAEVATQLATMHGLTYTPDVKSSAFRDWGDDPYGGGWNSWNIGVQSQVVKGLIVQPFDKRPFHICGEAYSDAQGWVEGALQTADMVLEKFGIPAL